MGDFATSTQQHDFEPGIRPSGLFWTLPMPGHAFHARPGAGTARFAAQDLAMPDFGDFGNAVSSPDPPTTPGHVTFQVDWSGGGPRTHVRDALYGFAGEYVGGDMRIAFTVSDDGAGVSYTSDPDGQATIGGGVGRERNGVFFDPSEDEHGRRPGARRRAPGHGRYARRPNA